MLGVLRQPLRFGSQTGRSGGRNIAGGRYRLDSWNRTQSGADAIKDQDARVAVRIIRLRKTHCHRNHVVGIYSEVGRVESQKAANGNARAGQQNHGERELCGHQYPREPVPATSSRCAAVAVFERCGDIQFAPIGEAQPVPEARPLYGRSPPGIEHPVIERVVENPPGRPAWTAIGRSIRPHGPLRDQQCRE